MMLLLQSLVSLVAFYGLVCSAQSSSYEQEYPQMVKSLIFTKGPRKWDIKFHIYFSVETNCQLRIRHQRLLRQRTVEEGDDRWGHSCWWVQDAFTRWKTTDCHLRRRTKRIFGQRRLWRKQRHFNLRRSCTGPVHCELCHTSTRNGVHICPNGRICHSSTGHSSLHGAGNWGSSTRLHTGTCLRSCSHCGALRLLKIFDAIRSNDSEICARSNLLGPELPNSSSTHLFGPDDLFSTGTHLFASRTGTDVFVSYDLSSPGLLNLRRPNGLPRTGTELFNNLRSCSHLSSLRSLEIFDAIRSNGSNLFRSEKLCPLFSSC